MYHWCLVGGYGILVGESQKLKVQMKAGLTTRLLYLCSQLHVGSILQNKSNFVVLQGAMSFGIIDSEDGGTRSAIMKEYIVLFNHRMPRF